MKMCSLIDDDGENTLMISAKSESMISQVCRSCDNQAQVVLQKKDAYCRICFLKSSIHKFRATLGKSKMLKAGEKVLVLFSGGQSSMALMHMLHAGLNEESNKRLIFNVDLIYIDDGLILQETKEKRLDMVRQVKEVAKMFGFTVFITTLSDVFSEELKIGQTLELDECKEEKLQRLFEGVKTMTAKEDLLYQLKHKIIAKIATNMNYSKVFTDEVGTDLAIKLLVGISLGRGDQMASEVGFCDNRNSEVPVLRPLKSFTQKEITFYNIFNDLNPIKVVSLTTMSSPDVSILKTTEKFINGLQEEYPSTVYTIFRTGDKLETIKNSTVGRDKHCALCNRIIKFSASDKCTVPKTLDFSRNIFQTNNVNDCDNKEMGVCKCSKSQVNNEDNMSDYFCYGCSLIFRDMDNNDFQEYLVDHAKKEENLQEIREQIADYLIE